MSTLVDLQPGETVSTVIRKHWFIFFQEISAILLGCVLILGTAGFVVGVLWHSGQIASILSTVVTFGAILGLLVCWFMLAIVWTNYYLDMWIVTNHRIFSIDQIGLFGRKVTSIALDNIQEITVVNNGFFGAVFGYGTVAIHTAGAGRANVYMEGIAQPEILHTHILEHMERLRQLEQITEKQESLLHSISHEVKSHLTKSQAAFASIVEGDFGEVPTPLKSIASTALSDTKQGVDTVMDILDASNFKKGTLEIKQERFDFKTALLKIVEEFKPIAAEKKLDLEVIVADGSYEVIGDDQKMRRHVLRNLIDNAIRYTPKGSVRVELTHNDEMIECAVHDNGVGITPEDMEHLFTEGGKGANSTKVNAQSTGYGLFVAKTIIDAHHGNIWAESEGAGNGAHFYVQLPLAKV